ncbi:MAG: amino acid-binding protein [Desulfovibrio sp.]|jgi:hypothetical protein|nr:amino acid-binding protein [Desulfovibrio sp.]
MEQLSVLLENKVGHLAEVTGILDAAGVRIKTLVLADTSEFGILRLIVDKTEEAYRALHDKGFTAGRTEVVALGLDTEAGRLRAILALLGESAINVEYMYACPGSTGGKNVIICRFDKIEKAVDILQANGVHIFSSSEI